MDTGPIRRRLDEFHREDGNNGIADMVYIVTRDVPALLEENKRLREHIQRSPRQYDRIQHVWVALVLLALVVGINAGLSFGVEGYWLGPPSALFAVLATIGLAITAYVASR